jgi:hypothetical protein
MAGKLDIGRDPTLNDLFLAFARWSERNHKPDTYEFYRMYQVSFIKAVDHLRTGLNLATDSLTAIDAAVPTASC